MAVQFSAGAGSHGAPPLTHGSTTCWMSSSNSGSADTDSIMPPTSLVITILTTVSLLRGSSVRSRATARMHSSSSSGPGRAWITQRGSRRRSRPLGDDLGMATNNRPAARMGQRGCSRGPPSGRTEARELIANAGLPTGGRWPRSRAMIPGPEPFCPPRQLRGFGHEPGQRRHGPSLLDSGWHREPDVLVLVV
jgi:hypothetical protein